MQAEETKGINLYKIVTYVKEVLCANTAKWNDKKKTLAKLNKDTPLAYVIAPDVTWFEYGRPPSLTKDFDVAGTLRRAIDSSRKKGNASNVEILAVLATLDFTTEELMSALDLAEPSF